MYTDSDNYEEEEEQLFTREMYLGSTPEGIEDVNSDGELINYESYANRAYKEMKWQMYGEIAPEKLMFDSSEECEAPIILKRSTSQEKERQNNYNGTRYNQTRSRKK
ncbi:hypothetical protein NGRA_2179 [Nosema granulosis]|uniref:Uncharacterized protein n=1 Tax=Nosema granulosis TaxID=83296 RepID=A0A9P6GX59_9MICR|nr:hypothetical protein NGRA_2179 [Nosema granulosis]